MVIRPLLQLACATEAEFVEGIVQRAIKESPQIAATKPKVVAISAAATRNVRFSPCAPGLTGDRLTPRSPGCAWA